MIDCKSYIKRGLSASGLLTLAQRLNGPRTVILRYHSVQERPEDYAHSIGRGIVHSATAFREQMEWLARTCEPIGLDDAASAVEGRRPMPRRGVLVTFDDGYADNLEVAAPILNRLGLKAAFYITVDCVEPHKMPWFCRLRHAFAATTRQTWQDPLRKELWRLTDAAQRRQAFLSASESCARRCGPAQEERIDAIEQGLGVERLAPSKRLMMNWEQIRELRGMGHVVGSHTVTHPNLAQINGDCAVQEIRESRRVLEDELRDPVNHFSYPSPILEPHWSAATTASCAAAGYRTAVTCTPGSVKAMDAPLCLKRVAAPENLDDFRWAVECAFCGRCV
ncbi:MAG TPA: polysaccharide deacetylase family protein [Gemmataceae bacterium]|nr:polysaccharide deacetylase family protein [Gemmataceae bacterium]